MIIDFIRKMFFALDKIIYGLIDDVYGLLLQLTRTSIFDQDVIHSFAIRVYALVGIFMLFKVSISLLTYLINPDEFASKEKGFGIIIRNFILALVILVIAPYVFNEAFEVQSMILEENTIMNLIFGTPPSSDDSQETTAFKNGYLDNYVNEAGGKIQFTILYAFSQPNYEEFAHDRTVADLNSCRDTYAKNSQGDFIFRKKAVINNGDEKLNEGETSNYIYELEQECFGVYDSDKDIYEMSGSKGQLYKAFENANASTAYQNYAQGIAQQSFSLFFTENAIMAKSTDGRYLINYRFFVSTAVGVAVLYFFIMFCIDVAIRSVKLGFLEMIAPIPIISYCDPKSGKDGMFKKWLDMLWKTYLELFIRLFALYFGIYVLSIIGTFRDVVTGDIVNDFFVTVFMIIGILIFIKKLPEILKEVFNLKGDGKFEFNPLKRFENDAFGGKAITGAAAGLVGGTVGALSGAGLARGLTAGIGGALGNKGWAETWKNTKDKNAKYRSANLVDRDPLRRTFHRATEGISGALGSGGRLAQIEREEANINRQIGQYDNQIKAAEERKNRIKGSANYIERQQNMAQQKAIADSLGKYKERAIAQVKAGQGDAGVHYNDLIQRASQERAAGNGGEAARLEQEAENYAQNGGWRAYATQVETGGFDDATLMGHSRKAQDAYAAANNGAHIEATGDAMNTAFGASRGAITDLEIQGSADERAIADIDREIAGYNEQKSTYNDQLRAKADEKKRFESYRV